MRSRRIASLVMCVCLEGLPLRAQEPGTAPAMASGRRIRFLALGAGRRVGTVVETDGEALVVSLAGTGQVVRVRLTDLQILEVSRGRRSRAPEGAIIGAAPGALIGALFGSFSCSLEYEQDCQPERSILGGLLFASMTAALGTAVGASVTTDRWEKVGVPQTRLQIVPTPGGGLAVGLKVSF